MIGYQILIPAFNASNTIGKLLKEISELEELPNNVIVINDGSTDNTAEIACKSGAQVFSLPENCGKGGALKFGIDHFLHNEKDDYLCCMDADLQHPVSSIPEFLSRIKSENSLFLIGNRKKAFKLMPWHRILSNYLTSKIISKMSGQKILDSQCGFRMIHRSVLEKIKLEQNGFQLESEMIVKASQQQVKIDFVDIPTLYNAEISNINNLTDTLRFILFCFKELKNKVLSKNMSNH